MAMQDEMFFQVLNAPSDINPSITIQTQYNLTSAYTYRFKVSAVNIVGESQISSEIFVIAADMPNKPTQPPTITLVT